MIQSHGQREATIDDLYRVKGKAELVNGQIMHFPPMGDVPSRAAGEVFISLREHCRDVGSGRAYGDNVAFLCDLPRRKSFCPCAAYYTGPRAGMKFLPQPPDFAVEVRSEGDDGSPAERAMAQKRADYFAAGTLVVWDVDLLRDDVVHVYRADRPNEPTVYCRGDVAEAEPAVPTWTMAVNDLIDPD